MGEEMIGLVFQYFQKASVAAVRITSGALKVGDTVHFLGNTTDFKQRIESIQVHGQGISEADTGAEVGIKVAERVRPNDRVYKVV